MSRQFFRTSYPFNVELRPTFEPEVRRAILARLTSDAISRQPRGNSSFENMFGLSRSLNRSSA